jgi:hypothetical protein
MQEQHFPPYTRQTQLLGIIRKVIVVQFQKLPVVLKVRLMLIH